MTEGADVVVGIVGKPFGVHGDVYVRPDPDIDHDFPPGHTYTPAGRTLTVAASRLHSGRRVVRFAEASDRAQAETLRGLVLSVVRDEVGVEADAFWTADLIGREVVDDSGAVVGVLEATADGPAHDYLVVARPDGGEIMIPAVAELVEVGSEAIVVHAIPGLLDPES